jgi:hypothetical protein
MDNCLNSVVPFLDGPPILLYPIERDTLRCLFYIIAQTTRKNIPTRRVLVPELAHLTVRCMDGRAPSVVQSFHDSRRILHNLSIPYISSGLFPKDKNNNLEWKFSAYQSGTHARDGRLQFLPEKEQVKVALYAEEHFCDVLQRLRVFPQGIYQRIIGVDPAL